MSYREALRPIAVKNIDAQEAPPFACMYLTGASEDDGRDIVLHVRRPTTEDEARSPSWRFVFNEGYPIAASKKGSAVLPSHVVALCKDESETYIGPVVNAWRLEKGNWIFAVVSDDPTDAYESGTTVSKIVTPIGPLTMVCKSKSTGIPANNKANVFYRRPTASGWEDTSTEYEAFNQHPTSAVGNSKILVVAVANGRLVVTTEFC